jgi:hypothetical protein
MLTSRLRGENEIGFAAPKADCSEWNIVAPPDVYYAQSCNALSTLRTTDWSLTKDAYDANHVDPITPVHKPQETRDTVGYDTWRSQ